MKMKLFGLMAFLLAGGAYAELVELECEVEGNDESNVFIIDLEAEEVDHANGGQFADVSISPTSVAFSSYGQPEDEWMMLRIAIQRSDLQVKESLYRLNEGKIKTRRATRGLLSWSFKVGEITPWSEDVTPDDWEFVTSRGGACKLVERKRAF